MSSAGPEPGAPPASPAPAGQPPADAPASVGHGRRRWLIGGGALAVFALLGAALWSSLRDTGPGPGFASGNGRIEATEVDVAAKLAGRVADVLVDEGDMVRAGQTLGHMEVRVLDAQRAQALATRQKAVAGVAGARAQVSARRGEEQAARAVVAQRRSDLDNAERRRQRSQVLAREGATSEQEVDDDRARVSSAEAALAAALAQARAALDGVTAAEAEVIGAQSAVQAAGASVGVFDADIRDSALTAPRDGRVQYRIAEPGEVLAAGGKVLNLVDLADVHITFFASEATAGGLALGSEVHVILDAAPAYVLPARVTFVASIAQFTPKTVETASERQKLMFRVKAQLDPALLRRNLLRVKTGVPGVAWLKLDPQAAWPATLATRVPP